MSMILHVDPATLPRSLVIDPPMTDAELTAFCLDNEAIRVERTREGIILMNAPAGGHSSSGNAELITQFGIWWKTHQTGRVFDSSGGFYLPDGSLASPDLAYLLPETMRPITDEQFGTLLYACPDFVVELRSQSDRLGDTQQKMETWIANGSRLAWLIDPFQERVFTYKPGAAVGIVSDESIAGEGQVAGFTLDLAELWKRYKL